MCLEVALLEECASQSVPPLERMVCWDLRGELAVLLVGEWAVLVEGVVVKGDLQCTAGRFS
jgi:hypothetical protein